MATKRFARIFTIFILFFSLSMVFAKPSHAFNLADWWKDFTGAENSMDKHIKSIIKEDQPNVNKLTNDVTIGGINTLQSLIGGVNTIPEETLEGMTEQERKIAYEMYGDGAIGDINTMTVALYHPPASTRTYVADIMKSAKIIPEAQAQGLGFASLDPILETWKVFKNIAYLFFVIIFVVIGFMIMFRTKIGGQTVVTAQQAIPNIIIALLFVTFSYAIAGLMIDLMYLLMYLLVSLFGGSNELMSKNFLQIGVDLVTGNGELNSVNTSVRNFADQASHSITSGALADVASFISGITLMLIITIAVLIGVFKLFFELLKTYVNIIISIAFAPLVLMIGALPGKNTFVGWIKNLIANLAAFPATLLLLIMYNMMSEQQSIEGGFLPPYMIGRGSGSAITTLVGIGIVLALPEAIKMIKKTMGATEGPFGQLAAAAMKTATQGEAGIPVLTGGVGMAGGAYIGGRQYLTDTKGIKMSGGKKLVGLGKAMWQGAPMGGTEPPRGGAKQIGGRWYDRGMSARRLIDRTKEGRILDAEDPIKMFREWSQANKGGADSGKGKK